MKVPYCNGKNGLCYEPECIGHKCPCYDGTGGYYVDADPTTNFNSDTGSQPGAAAGYDDDRDYSGLLDD